jgi:hypothetical protein
MLHGVRFVGVSAVPVLGARWYVRYVALDRVERLASALLHPPTPVEEEERLLSTMGVPERSRTFLEGHSCGAQLAFLVSSYGLEICSAGEIIGRSLLARYVVSMLEL